MPPVDLTTSAAVMAWLNSQASGTQPPSAPAVIGPLISRVSQALLSYLSRGSNIGLTTHTEVRTGVGNKRLLLKHWPLISITTLSIYGIAVPQIKYAGGGQLTGQNFYGYGYLFTPWGGDLPGKPGYIDLGGGCFPRDPQAISITYQAGYAVQNEQTVIPSNGLYAPLSPSGAWSADNGVSFVNGSALQAMPRGTNLVSGQYIPPDRSGQPGTYTFAAADIGQAVNVNYSFVPWDLEQAAIEQVAERYRYSARIAQKSVTQQGVETTTFSITDISPAVKTMIQPYKRPLGLSLG